MTENTFPDSPFYGEEFAKMFQKHAGGSIGIIGVPKPSAPEMALFVPDDLQTGKQLLTLSTDPEMLKKGSVIKVMKGGVSIGEISADKPDMQAQLDELISQEMEREKRVKEFKITAHHVIRGAEKTGQQKRRERRANERKNGKR